MYLCFETSELDMDEGGNDSLNRPNIMPSNSDIELNDLENVHEPLNDIQQSVYSDQAIPTNRDQDWLLLEQSSILKRFVYKLWYGPREPSDNPPTFPSKFTLLKKIDEFPEKIFRKRFPKMSTQIVILIFYCIIWFSIIYTILHAYLFRKPFFNLNNGSTKIPIYTYDCNSYLNWKGKNNACGLNARDCLPFEDKYYYIRCPALCDRGGWTYSAINVGDQRIKYQGYEIGGGRNNNPDDNEMTLSKPYRGDSFICGSAVHADIISPIYGGCAKVNMRGFQTSFPSEEGKHNTHFSVKFDSFFPSSYVFVDFLNGISSGCVDPRFLVITLNILFGLPVFYLYKSIIGYWIVTIVGYWTLVLSFDPPIMADPHFPETGYELLSIGFQRLLPLCFVLYVEWKCSVKRTLEIGSPLCKILLWYPFLWLGVMNNVTFDRLPVDRLTPKDLREQPGAATAVGTIAGVIFTCAIIQAYSLWKSGRFRKFFKIYITFICSLILLSLIPGLNLRLHHYILGIMLVPGCATRGGSAYMFQGILIGLILSGVSKWDFASIVETDFALLRGEAGASLPPPTLLFDVSMPHSLSWKIDANVTESETQISNKYFDGYSLLLNDFEVYVGSNTTIDIDLLFQNNLELSEMVQKALENSVNNTIPLYFRVARARIDSSVDNHGDYTNAGVLQWPEGLWTPPLPGVS